MFFLFSDVVVCLKHFSVDFGRDGNSWCHQEKAQNDLLRLIGGVALNAGDRLDWALQEDISS